MQVVDKRRQENDGKKKKCLRHDQKLAAGVCRSLAKLPDAQHDLVGKVPDESSRPEARWEGRSVFQNATVTRGSERDVSAFFIPTGMIRAPVLQASIPTPALAFH